MATSRCASVGRASEISFDSDPGTNVESKLAPLLSLSVRVISTKLLSERFFPLNPTISSGLFFCRTAVTVNSLIAGAGMNER